MFFCTFGHLTKILLAVGVVKPLTVLDLNLTGVDLVPTIPINYGLSCIHQLVEKSSQKSALDVAHQS